MTFPKDIRIAEPRTLLPAPERNWLLREGVAALEVCRRGFENLLLDFRVVIPYFAGSFFNGVSAFVGGTFRFLQRSQVAIWAIPVSLIAGFLLM